MGARIEISVAEYNSLKNRIKELEESCVKKDKELEILEYNVEKYKDIYKYIFEEITYLERIFQWKHIVRAVNESLGK
jgi:predicted nuclease with TOPRIM domain